MDKNPIVLFAEDEPVLGQIIKENLETLNFKVVLVENGEQVLKQFEQVNPEILVLDVMMPKKDGFSVAKEIRQIDQRIPIIFLTAKTQTRDVVKGFEAGGNDYLKKPFSMEELIVRINHLISRKKLQEESGPTNIGSYTFDFQRQTLRYKEEEQVMLTHREAHLLYLLCLNRNRILDRSMVLKKLWGDDDFFNTRSMDVFITRLRKKLSKDENIQILNVKGYGYKLTL